MQEYEYDKACSFIVDTKPTKKQLDNMIENIFVSQICLPKISKKEKRTIDLNEYIKKEKENFIIVKKVFDISSKPILQYYTSLDKGFLIEARFTDKRTKIKES